MHAEFEVTGATAAELWDKAWRVIAMFRGEDPESFSPEFRFGALKVVARPADHGPVEPADEHRTSISWVGTCEYWSGT